MNAVNRLVLSLAVAAAMCACKRADLGDAEFRRFIQSQLPLQCTVLETVAIEKSENGSRGQYRCVNSEGTKVIWIGVNVFGEIEADVEGVDDELVGRLIYPLGDYSACFEISPDAESAAFLLLNSSVSITKDSASGATWRGADQFFATIYPRQEGLASVLLIGVAESDAETAVAEAVNGLVIAYPESRPCDTSKVTIMPPLP